MSAELIFSRPRVTTGELVFGETDGASGEVAAVIRGSFAPLRGAFLVRALAKARIAGTFAPLTGAFSGVYNSNTQRPTVGQSANPWQVADKPNQPGAEFKQQDASAQPAGKTPPWQQATGTPVNVEHRLPPLLKALHVQRAPIFQGGTRVRGSTGFRYEEGARTREQLDGIFQNATRVRASTGFRYQDGDRTKRPDWLACWQKATMFVFGRDTDFQSATPRTYAWSTDFQDGVPPPPGTSLPPIEPPKPPGCYTPSGELVFSWPWAYNGASLVFQCGDY